MFVLSFLVHKKKLNVLIIKFFITHDFIKKTFTAKFNCTVTTKEILNRETFFALNHRDTASVFYETQIINPFLNSRISANQDKVD